MSCGRNPAPVIRLLNKFADRNRRAQAALELAAYWNADSILIFIPDPELGVLCPAPGFGRTLPGGETWRRFLARCSHPGEYRDTVAFPDPNTMTEIRALVADNNAVLALAGGTASLSYEEFAELPFALVSALLLSESAQLAASARVTAAHDATRRATSLASALDRARTETEAKAAELRSALGVSAQLNRQLRELNSTLEQRVEERTAELRKEIDERLKVEAALLQAQKMEAVGQLTGGVAHDFNNLLSVIIGSLDMLEPVGAHDKQARRLLELAQRAAQRGARLTEQLLAFARRQVLRPQIIDINDLIRDYQGLLHRAVGEAVQIQIDLAAQRCFCDIDPVHFETAILNLAVNSRDAMPAGGTLTIRTERCDKPMDGAGDLLGAGYVRISVKDTGIGIGKDILDRVVEPFFTTKSAGKGTGLGLSQVYGFVQQSGGRVALESVPGEGTTVRILLPLAEAPAMRADTGQPAEAPAIPGSELILVVEDDPDVADVVLTTFETLGYRTLFAKNGPDALSLLRSRPDIDLLFSDIVMPGGMSGTELACACRHFRPELKILLTSGYVPHARGNDVGRSSGFPLILKPYQPRELARLVRAVLDGDARASIA